MVHPSDPATTSQRRRQPIGGSTSARFGLPRRPEARRHRTATVASVVIAFGLFATGCAGEVPTVPADDAQLVQGREVYSSNCVGCHGAAGDGGTGPKLSDGLMAEKYPDPADLATLIADGRERMPAFGAKLTDEEIDAVVRFTRESL